ncbi:hypothetical protein [Halalkalibacterium ligniniphilum]|uniref:hypothetical protein n=1 Tax=Halalkalibacterium ligniniphilum TaxID=1134413 RepID=UPI000363B6FD|nr:hypothetical protein [Halalkalibacterium ligniniphilum]
MTLVFDSDNQVISYSETLITKSKDNKFVISSYFDGNLMQSEVTDIDYVSNDVLQEELNTLKNATGNEPGFSTLGFNEVALCISGVLLIDLTVARLIAGACITSCPAVPPVLNYSNDFMGCN